MLVILLLAVTSGFLSSCKPKTSVHEAIQIADRGDDRAAIAAYDEILRLQPENAEAAYLRGAAYDRLGNRTAAMADYDVALRLNAELLPAYLARADVRAALGDTEAAGADRLAASRLLIDDRIH